MYEHKVIETVAKADDIEATIKEHKTSDEWHVTGFQIYQDTATAIIILEHMFSHRDEEEWT